MTRDDEKAIRDLLAFYVEAGVDMALGEMPVDRFADVPAAAPVAVPAAAEGMTGEALEPPALRQDRSPAPAMARSAFANLTLPQRGEVPTKPMPAAAPPSPEVAVMQAREAARSAATLDDLRAILARFEGCALRSTATQLVFGDGKPGSRLMFVGEAPGRDEDIAGVPFVGVSGKLLDLMLAAIGLDRGSVYIANIVPWRPPGNRTPTPQESATCLPFTLRQIELANPDILVCLGQPSTQTLLGTKEGITRTRGRWFKFHTGTRDIRAMPTLHPAYLLRQPLQKRLAWRDFLAIKKALAQAATS